MNKIKSKEKIIQLVEKFRINESEYIKSSSTYNETEARNDFINEFFIALGWDVLNKKGLSKPRRDVVSEANLKENTLTHRPDYEFRVDSNKKFYVEAKKPSVDIITDSDPAYQTKRYGWNAKLPISLLTNFRDLVIYDSTSVPQDNHDSHFGRLKKFHYTEYVDKFDEIFNILSYESVRNGSIEENFGKLTENASELFDDYFLNQIEEWRILLANDLLKNNSISDEQINEYIQIFINRLVFLRTCEDRELESYGKLQNLEVDSAFKELMILFRDADKTYDSGLFEMLENESSFKVSNSVIVDVVKDLYLPNSPYSFSVIEPEILGDIYEEFIAKEISTKQGSVVIQYKPEIKASNGVYTTPKYIVNYILQETLAKDLQNGIDSDYSIADISCGSGIFLLDSYEKLLNYYLDKYINEQNFDKLIQDSTGDYHLSIKAKKEVLTRHIYGVDIDPHAVEVAKFSLYLKLIEDVTVGELKEVVNKNGHALPKLEDNIKVGNSLVDQNFFKYKNIEEIPLAEMKIIKPYDFDKKYNLIVGNPPYIKIQKMVQYSPLEVSYFNSKESPFESSKSNNYDKYMLFVERAIQLMDNSGKVGFILPNKFMKIKAGKALRETISSKNILAQIIDFDKLQVFGSKATTYTCIMIIQDGSTNIQYQKVHNIEDWKQSPLKDVESFPIASLSNKPWIFSNNGADEFTVDTTRLKDITEIFVGLQTSADDIYIFEPISSTSDLITFKDKNGKSYEIERNITKEAILDFSLNYLKKLENNRRMIFPYSESEGKYKLIEENELKQKFPLAYKYLSDNKKRLQDRHFSNSNPIWYQFGRSQSLQKFDSDKLIMKNPAKSACVVLDSDKIYFTGGGNGPYYGIRSTSEKYSHLLLSAILNSELFDKWVKERSSVFRGGYYSFSKQYIEEFPIFKVTERNSTEIERLENIWKEIYELSSKESANLSMGDRSNITKKKEYLKKTSDEIIDTLYINK